MPSAVMSPPWSSSIHCCTARCHLEGGTADRGPGHEACGTRISGPPRPRSGRWVNQSKCHWNRRAAPERGRRCGRHTNRPQAQGQTTVAEGLGQQLPPKHTPGTAPASSARRTIADSSAIHGPPSPRRPSGRPAARSRRGQAGPGRSRQHRVIGPRGRHHAESAASNSSVNILAEAAHSRAGRDRCCRNRTGHAARHALRQPPRPAGAELLLPRHVAPAPQQGFPYAGLDIRTGQFPEHC